MLKESVELALDEIRPSLEADGGDVELVDVSDEGVVKVRLTGPAAAARWGCRR